MQDPKGKDRRASSLAVLLTSRLPADDTGGNGLSKPNPEETTMTTLQHTIESAIPAAVLAKPAERPLEGARLIEGGANAAGDVVGIYETRDGDVAVYRLAVEQV